MLTVTRHDPIKQLKKEMRLKQNVEIRDRLHAVILALKGFSGSAIAERLGYGTAWVTKWVYRYRDDGWDGLWDRPRSGQPRKLTPKQETAFAALIEKGPEFKGRLARYRIKDLKTVLKERFGVDYSISGVKSLVHRLGFSSIKPRPRHPQNDPEAMKSWKREAPKFVRRVKKKESG